MSADEGNNAHAPASAKKPRGAQRPSLLDLGGKPASAANSSSASSSTPAPASFSTASAEAARPTVLAPAPSIASGTTQRAPIAWGTWIFLSGIVLIAALIYVLTTNQAEAPRKLERSTIAGAKQSRVSTAEPARGETNDANVAKLENIPQPKPAEVAPTAPATSATSEAASPSIAAATATAAPNNNTNPAIATTTKNVSPETKAADAITKQLHADAGTQPKLRGSGDAHSAPAAAAPSSPAQSSAKGDPSRDVVTRTPTASTEELLNRCRALGVLEGELCRFRICSGRWGTDPACPLSSSPPNTTQSTTQSATQTSPAQ